MVYAPGHFQRATRRRYRSRRERLSVQAAAIVVLVLVGLVAFSLTTHQRGSGGGCIDFNYTTMMGGSGVHECGGAARTLCATSPSGRSIDTDFQTELYAACRRAGIRSAR